MSLLQRKLINLQHVVSVILKKKHHAFTSRSRSYTSHVLFNVFFSVCLMVLTLNSLGPVQTTIDDFIHVKIPYTQRLFLGRHAHALEAACLFHSIYNIYSMCIQC